MAVGVVLKSGDESSLYVAAPYIATELARGREVAVFVSGEALLAFAGRGGRGQYGERMKALRVHWLDLLKEAKALGLRVYLCETALRIYGVDPAEVDKDLVDGVDSMYSFLEQVEGTPVVF